MTLIVTFDEQGRQDAYTALVRHWTTSEAHEKMGIYDGWGRAADQLEVVGAKL